MILLEDSNAWHLYWCMVHMKKDSVRWNIVVKFGVWQDVPKTKFMSNHVNYYYNVIPFGLKNIYTTYKRLMNVLFSKQIGQNLEVYIDDMTLKNSKGGKPYYRLRRHPRVNHEVQHAFKPSQVLFWYTSE